MVDYDSIISKMSDSELQSYYVFHPEILRSNIGEFRTELRKHYRNTNIGYSYKTNYLPMACKIAHEMGCYSEVVSEMELRIARNLNIPASKIIFNGPAKSIDSLKYALLEGAMVNVDNLQEMIHIVEYAKANMNQKIVIGLRINDDTGEDDTSRFGIQAKSQEYNRVIELLESTTNIEIDSLHCHSTKADKSEESFTRKLQMLMKLGAEDFKEHNIGKLDIGGGYFGKMDPEMMVQFDQDLVSYADYGRAIGQLMRAEYPEQDVELIIEPGVGLMANVMDFITTVIAVKEISGRKIAIVDGSFFNVKPSRHSKNLTTITINSIDSKNKYPYQITGSTCLENDILHEQYESYLEAGYKLLFKNVGAYTFVFVPLFINYPCPIIYYDNEQVVYAREKSEHESLFRDFQYGVNMP